MLQHKFDPGNEDKKIHSDTNIKVWDDGYTVTISDKCSGHCQGFMHISREEAIAAARAILRHFGEE